MNAFVYTYRRGQDRQTWSNSSDGAATAENLQASSRRIIPSRILRPRPAWLRIKEARGKGREGRRRGGPPSARGKTVGPNILQQKEVRLDAAADAESMHRGVRALSSLTMRSPCKRTFLIL